MDAGMYTRGLTRETNACACNAHSVEATMSHNNDDTMTGRLEISIVSVEDSVKY